MQRFLTITQRTVVWFKRVAESGELELKAPFQRNPVWSDRQKSALIETILLEYPIPEIYMQELTTPEGAQKQILVDGQQRIRAVLAFLSGELELQFDNDDARWSGSTFDDLLPSDRKKIFEYNFVVRLLPEMPDEELRSIFQRINRTNATLNAQELRHATYWGPFIKLMEELADLDFWTTAGVFSANDRRRMLDAEFISELAVATLNGLQNKKKKLEEYYQQYETRFDEAASIRSLFLKVVGEIEQVLPEISKTRWKKKSDFYTLFLKFASHANLLPLPSDVRQRVSQLLQEFASKVDGTIRGDNPCEDEEIVSYIKNVERAASDLGSRRARKAALDKVLEQVLPLQEANEQGNLFLPGE